MVSGEWWERRDDGHAEIGARVTAAVTDGPTPQLVFQERGNEIVRTPDGRTVATLQSRSPAVERALHEHAPSDVQVSWWDDASGDLSFLAEAVPGLRRFTLRNVQPRGLSVVSELAHLEALVLERGAAHVDFARLPRLAECELFGDATLGNLAETRDLRTLTLEAVRLRTVRELEPLSALRDLSLKRVDGLQDLDGIERLPLERLSLDMLRRLRSLRAIQGLAATLQSLDVDGSRAATGLDSIASLVALRRAFLRGPTLASLDCLRPLRDLAQLWLDVRQPADGVSLAPVATLDSLELLSIDPGMRGARDLEAIGALATLRHLALDGLGEIPSLGFVHGMRALETLHVRRTRVRDGDLGVLLELPRLRTLERLDPTPRHYTHGYDEIAALLAARQG